MRREMTPFHTGGDEHKGLDTLRGFFNNDD
jgi:hypothetical protein